MIGSAAGGVHDSAVAGSTPEVTLYPVDGESTMETRKPLGAQAGGVPYAHLTVGGFADACTRKKSVGFSLSGIGGVQGAGVGFAVGFGVGFGVGGAVGIGVGASVGGAVGASVGVGTGDGDATGGPTIVTATDAGSDVEPPLAAARIVIICWPGVGEAHIQGTVTKSPSGAAIVAASLPSTRKRTFAIPPGSAAWTVTWI